ncbi:MAG: hypothetical protein C5B49_04070 [Bdellovibrio sp.]|nr:MAG: hypothetical protein C5B49_04070 [Bdellovibrio sp.]
MGSIRGFFFFLSVAGAVGLAARYYEAQIQIVENFAAADPVAVSVGGEAATVISPPTLESANDQQGASDQQKELLSYRDGLNQFPNPSSCLIFQRLSGLPEFRLRSLARLRAILACPTAEGPKAPTWSAESPKAATWSAEVPTEPTESLPAAFESLRTEAQVRLAERQGRWEDYLDLLFKTVTDLKGDSEKVNALRRGLALAREKKLGRLAEKFEQALFRLAPRFRKPIQRSDTLDVGLDYLANREFDSARKYLKKVFEDSRFSWESRKKAYFAFRNSFKIEHDKQKHLKVAHQVFKWLLQQKDWQPSFEAGIYLARALWTEGLQTQTEKVLSETEAKLKKKVRTGEIDFIRGRMAAEEGKDRQAIAYFETATKNSSPASVLAFKAQYQKAWSLFHLGRYEEASAEFARARSLGKEQTDQVRSFYWQAKSTQKAGHEDQSKSLFHEIISDDPLGFYGLVSYRDCKESLPPLQKASLPMRTTEAKTSDARTTDTRAPALSATLPTGPSAAPNPVLANSSSRILPVAASKPTLQTKDRQMIADLGFVGERRLLENYLNAITENGNWDWENPDGLEILRAYAHAGLYLPLFSTLTKMPKDLREDLLLQNPDLLFPQEFAELIDKSAKKENLESELVFAIIRQESAFDPWVRSPADAMGLMQILPGQAKAVGKEIDIPFEQHDDLFSPEINIPIGAHLLKQSLNRYQGNFILGVASYNANDRAIRNWLKTRFRDDPLEFIEEIPYEETRAYVKLVLRNYIFYKRLRNPSQGLTFPNECLSNLQNFKTLTEDDVVSR